MYVEAVRQIPLLQTQRQIDQKEEQLINQW